MLISALLEIIDDLLEVADCLDFIVGGAWLLPSGNGLMDGTEAHNPPTALG